MADGSGGNGNNFLAFIVGGLMVVVAVFGFLMFNGGIPGAHRAPAAQLNVNVKGH